MKTFWGLILLLTAYAVGQSATKQRLEPGKGACIPKLLGKAEMMPDSFRLPKNENYKNSPLFSYSIPPNGIVTDVRLKRSSGSKSVDNAATKSISKWKYRPRDPICGTVDTEMSIDIDWR